MLLIIGQNKLDVLFKLRKFRLHLHSFLFIFLIYAEREKNVRECAQNYLQNVQEARINLLPICMFLFSFFLCKDKFWFLGRDSIFNGTENANKITPIKSSFGWPAPMSWSKFSVFPRCRIDDDDDDDVNGSITKFAIMFDWSNVWAASNAVIYLKFTLYRQQHQWTFHKFKSVCSKLLD